MEGVGVGTGGTVELGGPQSKATLCTPIEHSESFLCSGNSKETAFAPPHWVLEITEPPAEHGAVCLQVAPFPIS